MDNDHPDDENQGESAETIEQQDAHEGVFDDDGENDLELGSALAPPD